MTLPWLVAFGIVAAIALLLLLARRLARAFWRRITKDEPPWRRKYEALRDEELARIAKATRELQRDIRQSVAVAEARRRLRQQRSTEIKDVPRRRDW